MTPFSFTDIDGYTVGFLNGALSTDGDIALTPDAARNLASKLLQFSSQNTVGVRREYVEDSEYGGLHG